MVNYLVKHREGQFLVVGTVFLIIGYMLLATPLVSRLAFYIAIFFLGFFATKDALIKTMTEKSPNVDLLMVLAAIGAVVINYEAEGAMLLFIFAGAEVLEDFASNKSSQAIENLMMQVPNKSQLIQANGEVVDVPTSELQIGDIVLVAKGAQISIDGLVDRKALINEAALTGESLPVEKNRGDEVFAGTVNEGHVMHVTVNKTSDQTVFSNIIRMVEEAQNRPSRISSLIDRLEKQYVIGVLLAVPLFIMALMLIAQMDFQQAFYRGMVLLTVASPCALVASATPATLSAISNGAKNGVLFKGGAAMEALSTMDKLYTDKTGTLTVGAFQLVSYEVPADVLKEVIHMEQSSNHPIAVALTKHFNTLNLEDIDQTEVVEEVAGSGVRKGSILVGKPSSFSTYADPHNYRPFTELGNTIIFVGSKSEIIGYFSLEDQVRDEARQAIESFQAEGIDVELLTGDNALVASKVAKEVRIEHFQAACLPEDKIRSIQDNQAKGQVVGMIGDGINDAPALANADIGIAMGSGSAVAMESADVVIVKNDLAKLYYSYRLSKKLNKIIKQNIVFAISVIVLLIILNLFGILDLPTGVIFHEGSTILVILNGLRLLSEKDDSLKV